jgi:hypothetical protein
LRSTIFSSSSFGPLATSSLRFAIRSIAETTLTEGSERQVANKKRFVDEVSVAVESKSEDNDEDEEVDSVKSVLSMISQSVPEMMSNDEFDFDNDKETDDGDPSNDSANDCETSSSYPFSKYRQGWP